MSIARVLLLSLLCLVVGGWASTPATLGPLPKFVSTVKVVTWPTPDIPDKECYNAPTMARQYLDEGMPYPNDWEIDIVCNEQQWHDFLKEQNLLCPEDNPCTDTAFTIIAVKTGEVTDNPTDLKAGHTYLRAHHFVWWDHPRGPRHTMLHELGHIQAGQKENAAEAWAIEWEKEYDPK